MAVPACMLWYSKANNCNYPGQLTFFDIELRHICLTPTTASSSRSKKRAQLSKYRVLRSIVECGTVTLLATRLAGEQFGTSMKMRCAAFAALWAWHELLKQLTLPDRQIAILSIKHVTTHDIVTSMIYCLHGCNQRHNRLISKRGMTFEWSGRKPDCSASFGHPKQEHWTRARVYQKWRIKSDMDRKQLSCQEKWFGRLPKEKRPGT